MLLLESAVLIYKLFLCLVLQIDNLFSGHLAESARGGECRLEDQEKAARRETNSKT